MPEWARYAMAARWWKTSPWELLAQDDADFWTEAAIVLSNAENEASEKRSK